MEIFIKTIVVKLHILNVCGGPRYTSEWYFSENWPKNVEKLQRKYLCLNVFLIKLGDFTTEVSWDFSKIKKKYVLEQLWKPALENSSFKNLQKKIVNEIWRSRIQ